MLHVKLQLHSSNFNICFVCSKEPYHSAENVQARELVLID